VAFPLISRSDMINSPFWSNAGPKGGYVGMKIDLTGLSRAF
jgi:hypothetical protein